LKTIVNSILKMASERISRVKTGILGFDNLVEGGIPEGSLVLVSGTPGTGKTIFGMQFIANGARDFGEKGVYITFYQSVDSLCKQISRFGYDLKGLMDSGKIKIIEMDAGLGASKDAFAQLTDAKFIESLKAFKPKRIVLDSINIVTTLSRTDAEDGKVVSEVAGLFKYLGMTTLCIHERNASELGKMDYSTEEFLADGIVYMQFQMSEKLLRRFLTVIKMRQTNQSTGIYEFNVGNEGISIRS